MYERGSFDRHSNAFETFGLVHLAWTIEEHKKKKKRAKRIFFLIQTSFLLCLFSSLCLCLLKEIARTRSVVHSSSNYPHRTSDIERQTYDIACETQPLEEEGPSPSTENLNQNLISNSPLLLTSTSTYTLLFLTTPALISSSAFPFRKSHLAPLCFEQLPPTTFP